MIIFVHPHIKAVNPSLSFVMLLLDYYFCAGYRRHYEHMKKIIFPIVLYLIPNTGMACGMEPWFMLMQRTQAYADNADVIFFGEFTEIVDTKAMVEGTDEYLPPEQIVTFSVEYTYKGITDSKVKVINRFGSSCSRPFFMLGSKFYVFASYTKQDKTFLIDGGATFIPESIAIKNGFVLETVHDKQAQPTADAAADL